MADKKKNDKKDETEKPLEGEIVKDERHETDTRLARVAPKDDLAIIRDPDVVLAEAKKAAEALAKVIRGKEKKVVFSGEQYLEVEDWTMLGQFYGVSAKTEWTREIVLKDARGWEARVVIVDMRTGIEVGGAEAMCLDSEENWGVRNEYKWLDLPIAIEKYGEKAIVERQPSKYPNKPMRAKVIVGTLPVSDASRRSMAQTRATSRALAMRLRWIPVLAGFSGTPAEDMPKFWKGGPGGEASGAPEEDPGPPSDAAPTANEGAKPEPPKPAAKTSAQASKERQVKGGVSDSDYDNLPGWAELKVFHRFGVEHADDPRVPLFRKFMNDHGLNTWRDLAGVWGDKCSIPQDKDFGNTIGQEVGTLISPMGMKPDQPFPIKDASA